MGSFFPIVIIAIIYAVINGAMKKNAEQKKRAQQQQNRAAAPGPAASAAPHQRISSMEGASSGAPSGRSAAPADDSTWTDRVNEEVHRGTSGELHPTERRMEPRLDSARMTSPVMDDEGEDACHAYMLDDEALPGCIDDMPEHDYDAPRTEGGASLFTGSDILRGVVMSEILNRPGQRKYARRRA